MLAKMCIRDSLENAPGIHRDGVLYIFEEGDLAAVFHLENRNGILGGVGSRHVVVVFIAISPYHAARQSFVTQNGFDPHADIGIASGEVVQNR